MSRRSMITITVGLFAFMVTLLVSNLIFNTSAPSGAGIMASPQTQIEKLQLAETLQTTFLFVAILELMIAGVLAYSWRKADIPDRSGTDDREEGQKQTFSTAVRVSVFTGIIAFVTSYMASLLDVFVFNVYGGLSSNVLICQGIPAGLFGMLGGIVWHKIKGKSKFARIDLAQLLFIGIAAGTIPGACLKMLPQ